MCARKGLAVLTSLRLQNFRCFRQLALELPAGGGIFLGENAQGKTSVLEAVCILVRLHSPRTHRMGQMVRVEEKGFGIAGEVFDEERQVRYQPGRGGGTLLRREGEEVATGRDYLADGGLVVWMGNEDAELVRGPAEGRRHYMDFICAQVEPGYRRALSRYTRALRARNILLKDRNVREAELLAYSEILVVEGSFMQATRSSVIAGLTEPASAAHAGISGRDEVLSMTYRMSGEGELAAAFEQAWEKDLQQRTTGVGPHRDDVKLSINGLPARDYASEGQQRTAALALKLAQGELLRTRAGRLPIYLIDDIFGELDAGRRNALMGRLPGEAQKMITTTSLDWLADREAWKVFKISAGELVD